MLVDDFDVLDDDAEQLALTLEVAESDTDALADEDGDCDDVTVPLRDAVDD